MTAHTVNAYYNATQNEIVFPAGILQRPFYGFDTYEENIGAIGVVIGHEMTHGYDDRGSQYNHIGELKEWWTGYNLTIKLKLWKTTIANLPIWETLLTVN